MKLEFGCLRNHKTALNFFINDMRTQKEMLYTFLKKF